MALVDNIRDNTNTIMHGTEILSDYLEQLRAAAMFVSGGKKVPELMATSIGADVKIVIASGYNDSHPSLWLRRGSTTSTPSQSPVQRDELSFTDAAGAVFDYMPYNRMVNIDDLGATRGSTVDSWPTIDMCLRKAPTGYRVTGGGSAYRHNKPIAIRTGDILDFGEHLYCDFYYGGGVLTAAEAPDATTPAGVGMTSVFSGKSIPFIFVHTDAQYVRRAVVRGIYSTKIASATAPAYSVYAPFLNQCHIEGCQFVGFTTAGVDGRNWYTCGFREVFFTGGTGAAVGINVTPITNGLGSGTSNTFDRVGILECQRSWLLTEMNYSNWISCYSEGTATQYAMDLTRCHEVQVTGYGIENLRAVSGNGQLFRLTDTQATITGLGASFNVNLQGTSAFLIRSTNSTIAGQVVPPSNVRIQDVLVNMAAGVTSWQWWLITDTNGAVSEVDINGLHSIGTVVTPVASIPNKKTIYRGVQGQVESIYIGAEWDCPARFANIRMFSNGAGLWQKANSDPTSASDGVAM